MNPIQKQYEFKSKIPTLFHKIEPEDYFRYLSIINTRKNQYLETQTKFNIKRNIYEPFKDPSIIEANRRLKLKIYSIIEEPPLPKINKEYLEVKETITRNKEKCREIAQRALSIENEKYKNEVFNQKPRVELFRKIKKLHINHNNSRANTISRTKRSENEKRYSEKNTNDLILPKINRRREKKVKEREKEREKDEIIEKTEKLFQTEVIPHNNNSVDDQSIENTERLNEHKYEDISHQKQGHIYG